MTLRLYIWGLFLVAILSWAGLGLVLFFVDPQKSGPAGILLFYLVLFFALSFPLNLLMLGLRKKIMSEELFHANIGLTFRQATLLSLLTICLLVLQSFRFLVWWDGLFVVALFFLAELYFLHRK